MTDTLPDGRDIDLLDHPFDQYQRYQDIRRAVDAIRVHDQRPALRILDVGGTLLSQRFLPEDVVIPANLEPGDSVQLQTDGARLALRDASFDVVITVDTLEHVPAERRAAFLAELRRAASGYIILTGPFANGYNEAAERILNDYLVNTANIYHRFLTEHLQNGLPDLELTRRALAPGELSLAIPSGYVQHWLPLMIIKHELQRWAGGQAITDELDRIYNYAAYWRDHQLPSYRHLVVAARTAQPDGLRAIARAFETNAPVPALDLNGVIALWQATRWPTILREQARDLAESTTQRQAAQQAHASELAQLQAENQRLARLVHAYEAGRFIRLAAMVKRLFGSRH